MNEMDLSPSALTEIGNLRVQMSDQAHISYTLSILSLLRRLGLGLIGMRSKPLSGGYTIEGRQRRLLF